MPAKNRGGVRAATFSLTDFLPYKLAVVTESIARAFTENYGDKFNLTIPEWRALAVIAEFGTLSPTAVGQRTAMDKVKVSRAAQSLVAKGMLRQTQDPTDGRGRLLRLTRKGVATHARMVPVMIRMQATLFEDLSRAETAALDRVLTKIATRFETIAETGPESAR
jgi:DNA-binding MarR family transcriptional regulator